MDHIIPHRNATPVVAFPSLINARLPDGEALRGKRILDCGAGGPCFLGISAVDWVPGTRSGRTGSVCTSNHHLEKSVTNEP